MAKKAPISLKVNVLQYGLGYPPGYRPLDLEIKLAWNDQKAFLEIETSRVHQLRWHSEDGFNESHAGMCEPGIVQPAYWDDVDAYRIILETNELTIEDMQRALQIFCTSKGIEAITTEFSPSYDASGLEEEHRAWKEHHEQYMEWLSQGAPPYKIAVADTFVDSLLEISGTETEREDDLMEGMGFERDGTGAWKKDPDPVLNEPHEWYVELLQDFAQKHGDMGPLFLSPGSWPRSVAFVANGKRYESAQMKASERAWYGYLLQSHIVVLFPNRTESEVITIEGEPDILSALERVPSGTEK